MRGFRFLLSAAVVALAVAGARAADPVVVELNPSASVGTAVVTVGDVALISGGDADTRARVSKIDLTELKSRDRGAVVGRPTVGYRLELAGFDATAVRVIGADRVSVTPARRAVTVEEVVAAARAEVLRQTADAPGLALELAQPVVVKLPEVPANERVTFTAKPRGKATGRVQVDVTIACAGEALLALAVYLDVREPGRVVPAGAALPAGAAAGPAADPKAVLVKARQQVEVTINSGGLKAIMAGEAQGDGRLGQSVFVLNPGSKKLVPATVTGPGKLEVVIGGLTP